MAEDHLEHIDEVLRLLKKASVTAELKKRSFYIESTDYLV